MKGTVTYFPCDLWLDKDEGDGQIRRQLMAAKRSTDQRKGKSYFLVIKIIPGLNKVSLFVNLFVCLSVSLFVCLSVCLFVCQFVCMSVSLFVCLLHDVSVCLSNYPADIVIFCPCLLKVSNTKSVHTLATCVVLVLMLMLLSPYLVRMETLVTIVWIILETILRKEGNFEKH